MYNKVYWIIYSKVKKKHPHLPVGILHMLTRKAIEKRQHKKKEPKGLTANLIVIDECPLKEVKNDKM